MGTNVVTKTVREHADFSKHQIYVGLDVHKKSWSVTVYVGSMFFQTYHQQSDPLALQPYLHNHFPGGKYLACYEAGFCGFSVQRELTALGIECTVVNPADIAQTNKGVLSKTDASDSRRIAAALSSNMLRPIYIPDRVTESDRQLMRYRRKVQCLLQAKRKSLKSALYMAGIQIPVQHDKPYWTNNFIQWLKTLQPDEHSLQAALQFIVDDVEGLRQRLLQTNRQIKALSQSAKYQQAFDIITSAPGIGLITAMTMLTEIGNIDRFDSFTKFNSFIGLCPGEFSSGEHIYKGKMTPRNHREIRPLMIEAAWIAIRTDPALTLKFQELIKTKTKKRAIVIIARKLLSRIYTIWKRQQRYETAIVK